MRIAVVMTVLAVVGIMIVAGTVILCGTGQEQQGGVPCCSHLFHVFNTDDVPHEVNVTVFDANVTRIRVPVCTEVYRLEADGDVTSFIKNDGSSIKNDGREYHFEISVDGEDPEVFVFSIARCHSLAISVRAERDIQALMITSNYAVPAT
ncbi:MAG: hypothetical protein CVV31_01210 [Methanomicrobiales archaeon HGW-Methanomicrobiales-2]|jgi:hypothetical protein|nr:MAG: hypothetical protein CVV34_05480 [Methanomicrobiales archaeon HGW-Methanomicrobiales-5]PKL63442.1 MAG: hypothetical protein CVV31_01210 [Methanomicrobiales archaeon HGW-Methanomicrobiales-2]